MTTLRFIGILVVAIGLFLSGRHVGYVEGARETTALRQQIAKQLEVAKNTRLDGPVVRVGLVNARLRRLLQSHGIDPETEGVYAK